MLLFWNYAAPQYTEFPKCHMQIQQYVVPEWLFSLVAENHSSTDLLSACDVFSTFSDILYGVLSILDFILGSVVIRPELTKQVLGKLLANLVVCEVIAPTGVACHWNNCAAPSGLCHSPTH